MKKLLTVILVLMAACVLLLIGLFAMAKGRQSVLLSQSPLTLAELDRLTAKASKLGPPEQEAPVPAPQRKPLAEPSSDMPPDSQEAARPKPTPNLFRALNQAEREARWPIRSTRLRQDVVTAFMETAACVLDLAGRNSAGGWYWEAAQEAEQRGDTDTATAYYHAALNYPNSGYVREWCCSRLAAMENDPVLATRLLELSCATNDPIWVADAIRLCKATESDGARAFYEARMRLAIQNLRDQNNNAAADVYKEWLNEK